MDFKPKLVRDKIPEIIAADGKECDVYVLNDDSEYRLCLFEKMYEEVDEFQNDPSLEEAADVYEVFMSLLELHGLAMGDVWRELVDKRSARGGFSRRIFLRAIEEKCNFAE